MKKLHTLFSPKKVIVWIFVGVLIFTTPKLSMPAMSRTEAIVTMICIEKVEDKTEIATVVLSAGEDKKASYQVYTSVGENLADATKTLAEMLGKELGFAQCEIIAFGDNAREKGVMADLDFLIRTRKTSGNSVLVAFSGKTKEFAQTITDLGVKKGLKFDEVINNDRHFAYSKDSKLDSFYKNYFEKTALGIMPYVRFEKEEKIEAIEVQASSSQDGGNTKNEESEKKYLINDGTAVVLKNGKESFKVDREMCEKINLFLQEAQIDLIKVENVNDEIFDGSDIVFRIEKKKLKFAPSFENGAPIFKTKIETIVRVEEVVSNNPNDKFLVRNKEFLTDLAIKKLEEKIKETYLLVTDFCIENDFDILGVFKQFNAKCYTNFKEFLKDDDNYLPKVKFDIDIKINSLD